MPDRAKSLVKLAAELAKIAGKGVPGGEAVAAIIGAGTELVGEESTNRVRKFLNQERERKRLLRIFSMADRTFVEFCNDDELRQFVISQPFRGLDQLEQIEAGLDGTLDEEPMVTALRDRFVRESNGRIDLRRAEAGARLYLDCLDTAAWKESLPNQLDTMLMRTLRRMDHKVDTLLEMRLATPEPSPGARVHTTPAMSGDQIGTATLDSRMLKYLGRSVFSDVTGAVVELVQNSWDADASHVRVESREDSTGRPCLVVSDDGRGMTSRECAEHFLRLLGDPRVRATGACWAARG